MSHQDEPHFGLLLTMHPMCSFSLGGAPRALKPYRILSVVGRRPVTSSTLFFASPIASRYWSGRGTFTPERHRTCALPPELAILRLLVWPGGSSPSLRRLTAKWYRGAPFLSTPAAQKPNPGAIIRWQTIYLYNPIVLVVWTLCGTQCSEISCRNS